MFCPLRVKVVKANFSSNFFLRLHQNLFCSLSFLNSLLEVVVLEDFKPSGSLVRSRLASSARHVRAKLPGHGRVDTEGGGRAARLLPLHVHHRVAVVRCHAPTTTHRRARHTYRRRKLSSYFYCLLLRTFSHRPSCSKKTVDLNRKRVRHCLS